MWGLTGMVFAATYPNDVRIQLLIPSLIFSAVVISAFVVLLVYVEEPNAAEAQASAKANDPGVVPSVRRMLRNPVYRNCV